MYDQKLFKFFIDIITENYIFPKKKNINKIIESIFFF